MDRNIIKPNDLRIGNIVLYEQTYHCVTGIDSVLLYSRWYQQLEEESDYSDYYRNYKPIPLTPELLEKCGFKDCGGVFVLDGVGAYPMITEDYYANDLGHELKYLHQLQNLYFSLTGEELICKL